MQYKLKEAKLEGKLPESCPINAMLWLDDVVSENEVRTDPNFRETAVAGRHYDLCVGINTQHVTGIPPTVRANADLVVIFAQPNGQSKRALVESYLGMLNSRTAMELIDMYTVDHGCLILELWRNTQVPEDFIFHYVAKEPPSFAVDRPMPKALEKALNDGSIEMNDENEDDQITLFTEVI
jgi:hypothetical protein